jgi:hypothetical protein
MAFENLNKVLKRLHTKAVLIALFVVILAQYFFYDKEPMFTTALLGVLTVVPVSFGLSRVIKAYTITNFFMIGALSYGAFVAAQVFFKILEAPVINEEIKTAIVFGAVSAVAFLELE